MKYSNIEYIDLMTFRGGRPMFCELFGPLIGLADEWAIQGASDSEIALDAFGFDSVEVVTTGGNCGFIGLGPEILLEDNDRFRITRDGLGRTLKLPKGFATIALPMDFPVKTMDDWLRIKPHLLFCDRRVDLNAAEKAAAMRRKGALTRFNMPGAFSTVRELMGDEATCFAFYDHPEMMHDIIQTLCETTIEVMRRIGRIVVIDHLCTGEDLAGKSGPLVSPEHVKTFYEPYYKAVWDAAREAGAALFSQDSDGYVEPVMEAFMECGVNVFYPCEPAAGMDIVKLRQRFGSHCAYKGGIDKFALRGTFDDIERELQYKLTAPALGSGIVFGLDHRIPNGVPIENYRFYVRRAREILGLPEAVPDKWVRMAF